MALMVSVDVSTGILLVVYQSTIGGLSTEYRSTAHTMALMVLADILTII